MLKVITNLFKSKPKERDVDTPTMQLPQPTVPKVPTVKMEYFKFKVAGITMENCEGQDVQETLRKYALKYCKENDIELFGGYTNKEILDDVFLMDGVYEFEDLIFNNKQITFVPEPDNPYDKNAIKIYIDFDFNQLHIGYVPKKQTAELMRIIQNEKVKSVEGRIVGGNLKEGRLDYHTDKYKVEKKQLTLGFYIDISYIVK